MGSWRWDKLKETYHRSCEGVVLGYAVFLYEPFALASCPSRTEARPPVGSYSMIFYPKV